MGVIDTGTAFMWGCPNSGSNSALASISAELQLR